MSAEPPADPSEPVPGAEPPPARPEVPGGEPAEFPRQKRRYRQNESGAEAGLQEQHVALLSSLLMNLMQRGSSEAPTKEIHRFRGKGIGLPVQPAPAEAAAPPPVAPSVPAPAPVPVSPPAVRDYTKYSDQVAPSETVAEAPPVAPVAGTAASTAVAAPAAGGSVEAAPDLALSRGTRPFLARAERAEEPREHSVFGYWVLVILVGVAAFAAGRWTSGKGPYSPAGARPENAAQPAPAWSEENVAALDRILEADQAGDLDGAGQLANQLQDAAGPLPGLASYLGDIVVRHRKLADAQSTLSRMLAPGLEGARFASLANALAFAYTRQRRFALASQTFQQAALAEPFAPETYRRWAESLRREGHFEQAVKVFRESLARYPIGPVELMAAREYVEYEIRLTEIEGSLPVDARADNMATANASGYGFLADAAAALERGNGEAAAAALQQAKAALPPPLFEALLGDYFFRAYLTQPQIASFFPPNHDAEARRLRTRLVYFIDP